MNAWTEVVRRLLSSNACRWIGGNTWIDALATGVVSGLIGVAILAGAVHWCVPATITGAINDGGWTNRSRAWIDATRLYPAERYEGQAFTWTSGSARLSIPQLNRSRPSTLTLHLSAPRPTGHEFPTIAIWIDGTLADQFSPSGERTAFSVTLPVRSARGANIRLDVSNTFVPGPHDVRMLGAIVHDVTLSSPLGFRLTAAVLGWTFLAIAMTVAGLLWCGPGRPIGIALAALVMGGYTWLLVHDATFLGSFIHGLVNVSAGVAIIGAGVGIVRSRAAAWNSLPEWGSAAAIALGAAALKLSVFVHPRMTVGDGIFQVHRALNVQNGEYFFTSITPRPFFEFPYAIGLYVAAMPFWSFFPTMLGRLVLLRGVTLAADALVGVALYAAARRQWGSRGVALLCAVLWPLSQAPMHAINNANLTNAFAQSLFSIGMAAVIWFTARGGRSTPWVMAVAGVAFAAGFLSHMSTLAVGVPLVALVSSALLAAGQGRVRRMGVWVLALGLVAAASSYVIYYAHFSDVYRETIARVRAHEQSDEMQTRSSIAASPTDKLRRWLLIGSDDYGRPGGVLLLASVAGAVLLVRQRPREAATLVLAGWSLAWIGWTMLGILTPVQMRAALASAPLFVCLAAYGIGTLANRSRAAQLIAAATVLLIAWDGVRVWRLCLGLD